MFQVTDEWKAAFPGAVAGVLVMRNVTNPAHHELLDCRKDELETELRARWVDRDRSALCNLPTIEAYNAYYARFRKTYHVLLQLESVVLKGRPLPRVAALVEAMFMAELKNQLLTAGHHRSELMLPVTVDMASGSESYVTLGGKEQKLTAGDMYMRDAQGVISSILYGPDRRTAIQPTTKDVLFTVYAPPGIASLAVKAHLDDIRDNVLVVAPDAEVELSRVYLAE
jgi:DNA/RNA-binding domain of Phe-tRNA-synthetase-like protein